MTKEEFQGQWTAPAPEFTPTQSAVTDWSEGYSAVPPEDWSAQPATGDWSAAPTAHAQATEWLRATTECS